MCGAEGLTKSRYNEERRLSVLFCSICTIMRCFIGIMGPWNQPLPQAQKPVPLMSTYNPKQSWDHKAELTASDWGSGQTTTTAKFTRRLLAFCGVVAWSSYFSLVSEGVELGIVNEETDQNSSAQAEQEYPHVQLLKNNHSALTLEKIQFVCRLNMQVLLILSSFPNSNIMEKTAHILIKLNIFMPAVRKVMFSYLKHTRLLPGMCFWKKLF